MKRTATRPLRTLPAAALIVCGALAAGLAEAANHALIMWIGDYGDPKKDLPGIEKDGAMARQIALSMSVPEGNITELGNRQFTKAGVIEAFSSLARRIGKDDNVFIYYSGHGKQIKAADGEAKCTEGMVTRDPNLYEDFRLQDALTALGGKASQVVMMSDSCFSGGAATKSIDTSGLEGAKPKFYSGNLPAGAFAGSDHTCGDFVNKVTRNLTAVPRPPQVLYIAAAAADEVSLATRNGSLATLAWQRCMRTGDADRSGAVDGNELRACAQQAVGRRQTITLVGNTALPLTFTAAGGGTSAAARVNPAAALENIRALRDPEYVVKLQPARTSLRINQEFLEFSVSSNRDGYLYVLHVGSDGKAFDVLFPNKLDSNNRINAGTYQLPRQNWQVRPGGPAGTSYLMAVVSPVAKDFTKGMDRSSDFASGEATAGLSKNLIAEASGAGGRAGRVGASDVVAIRETN